MRILLCSSTTAHCHRAIPYQPSFRTQRLNQTDGKTYLPFNNSTRQTRSHEAGPVGPVGEDYCPCVKEDFICWRASTSECFWHTGCANGDTAELKNCGCAEGEINKGGYCIVPPDPQSFFADVEPITQLGNILVVESASIFNQIKTATTTTAKNEAVRLGAWATLRVSFSS